MSILPHEMLTSLDAQRRSGEAVRVTDYALEARIAGIRTDIESVVQLDSLFVPAGRNIARLAGASPAPQLTQAQGATLHGVARKWNASINIECEDANYEFDGFESL